MAFEPAAGPMLNLLGAVVVALFGFFALALAPGARSNRAFVLFAVAFGTAVGSRAIAEMMPGSSLGPVFFYYFGGLAWLFAAAGLMRMVFVFPLPMDDAQRLAGWRLLATLLGLFVALYVLAAVWYPGFLSIDRGPGAARANAFRLGYSFGSGIAIGLWAIALVMIAWRHHHAREPETRRGLRIMTWAEGPYGVFSITGVWFSLFPILQTWATGLLFMLGLVVAFWLRETWRSDAVERRGARNLALALSAIAFATAVFMARMGSWEAATGIGVSGVIRLFAVAVLTYGVVRHQVLGFDARIRWTISRSTVAAAFVAVFFVVSEFAQEFFGGALRSQYWGIAAAGLLVLAISPLQRFADRLAVHAVPVEVVLPSGLSAGVENAYLGALRAALRDGVIERREERHLMDVADHLGIPAGRALALRELVEAETPA